MSSFVRLQELLCLPMQWKDFVRSKKVEDALAKVLEEGWKERTVLCLAKKFQEVPFNEIIDFVEKTAMKVNAVCEIDKLLRYLRYAYFTAGDDLDFIIEVLDEKLSQISSGTPTYLQCKEAYKEVMDSIKS